MIVMILKFIMSVRGGHCYCLPRTSINLATPVVIMLAYVNIDVLQ